LFLHRFKKKTKNPCFSPQKTAVLKNIKIPFLLFLKQNQGFGFFFQPKAKSVSFALLCPLVYLFPMGISIWVRSCRKHFGLRPKGVILLKLTEAPPRVFGARGLFSLQQFSVPNWHTPSFHPKIPFWFPLGGKKCLKKKLQTRKPGLFVFFLHKNTFFTHD